MKVRPDRPLPTPEQVAAGLLSAARQAIEDAELQRCVGESGRLQLAVELKLNGGHIVNAEAGVGFRRRVY